MNATTLADNILTLRFFELDGDTMNYMKNICDMLCVKPAEEFFIAECGGSFFFADDGLYIKINGEVKRHQFALQELLNGEWHIDDYYDNLDDDMYFYYWKYNWPNSEWCVERKTFHRCDPVDMSLYYSGNCYRSKQAAQRHRKELEKNFNDFWEKDE